MHIAKIETVRQIGEEYGWEDHQIEMALVAAIRLCYMDYDMLVEVDVNMEAGSITARRRNGYADKGVWIDINNPLMPSVKMFLHVMEMQQWGDGAPGRVLEGIVSGYRDGGIIYRVNDNMVYVPENLLSVKDFHEKPELGTEQVLALCSTKISGMRIGSRRGKEFVSAIMECYYPGCISGIWMGASNSWAVIRMSPDHVTEWLAQGGLNIKHLQGVLGVRRITLLPEGLGEDEQLSRDNELRHFVNNAWKDCKIGNLEPEKIVIYTPMGTEDPRKLRTFTSMLKKIAPEREQVIM